MLTINAEIKKDGLRPDGTCNIKLRFTLLIEFINLLPRACRRNGSVPVCCLDVSICLLK